MCISWIGYKGLRTCKKSHFFTRFRCGVRVLRKLPLRKLPTGKFPPRKFHLEISCPRKILPRKIPPREVPLRKISPRKIPSLGKFPPGNFPPNGFSSITYKNSLCFSVYFNSTSLMIFLFSCQDMQRCNKIHVDDEV